MSKDKYPSIFLTSNGGCCVYYPSNIVRNMRDLFTNSLLSKTFTAYEVDFFGVFWFRFIEKLVYFFFCHKGKPFSHLDIYFNCKLEALNFVLIIGNITRMSPSFS